MGLKDKFDASAKKMEGQLESAAGDLTGNQEMKAKGEAKQAQGAAMETVNKVQDQAKGLVDGLKNTVDDTLKKLN